MVKWRTFALIATFFAVLLSLVLIYLKRVRYHVGSEQQAAGHGVFQRRAGYIELCRVVDFLEQSLLQQVLGLKTVTVQSMDGTTLKLELTGLHERINIVDITRERVEYNKQRKGIYEIVNKREQPTSPLEGMSSAEAIALHEITNH